MTASALPRMLLAAALLVAAFAARWMLGPFAAGIPSALPSLGVIAAVSCLWMLPRSARWAYAAGAGFAIDALALPPFGAAMIVLLAMAALIGAMKKTLAARGGASVRAALLGATAAGVILATPAARLAARLLSSL